MTFGANLAGCRLRSRATNRSICRKLRSGGPCLTIAIGIAQIGEFSFILAEMAREHRFIPAEGQSLLAACSIVTISLNPLLFRRLGSLEKWLERHPGLWSFLADRSATRVRRLPTVPQRQEAGPPRAIIVGYGPVGKTATAILKGFGVEPVVVNLNIETVSSLVAAGELAVYRDATRRAVLEAADIASAQYLLVTSPDPHTRTLVVLVARELESGHGSKRSGRRKSASRKPK